MPTRDTCHPAAMIVARTGSVVWDVGFAGVVSTGAASVLRVGYERGLSAGSAASDAGASQSHLTGGVLRSASSPDRALDRIRRRGVVDAVGCALGEDRP